MIGTSRLTNVKLYRSKNRSRQHYKLSKKRDKSVSVIKSLKGGSFLYKSKWYIISHHQCYNKKKIETNIHCEVLIMWLILYSYMYTAHNLVSIMTIQYIHVMFFFKPFLISDYKSSNSQLLNIFWHPSTPANPLWVSTAVLQDCWLSGGCMVSLAWWSGTLQWITTGPGSP